MVEAVVDIPRDARHVAGMWVGQVVDPSTRNSEDEVIATPSPTR
jgi:hypothetical protein